MSVAKAGKRVGRNTYAHRDALHDWPAAIAARVFAAEALCGCQSWNVAKWSEADDGRLSLLTYEDFEAPFPTLLESLTVDMRCGSVSRRTYRQRANPPVLHRKELLLARDDPRRSRFAALTARLEGLGLLTRTASIGTRLGWAQKLREAGVRVVGDDLVEATDDEPAVYVPRHLAAIQRSGLSTPIQALLRYDLLAPGDQLFDYGCGRGSDIEGLQTAGVLATGWDPHFAPDAPKSKAAVVNLGFVLNVIEKPLERIEALRGAFALTERCLAVAVITSSRARLDACRPYADGHLTGLGTFQKFFLPEELKALVEEVLGHEAHPAGPGLLFVFRDPMAEQAFLAARQTRQAASPLLALAHRRLAREAKLEAIKAELEAIATETYRLGRPPAAEECQPEIQDRLTGAKVGWTAAARAALSLCEAQTFAKARRRRVEDLSVYFALNLFNARHPYKALPARLQRDVKAFFGSLLAAEAAGRTLLQSLASAEPLAAAARAAQEAGAGWCDPKGDLWVAVQATPRLTAPLRCFAGCAERFAGDFEEVQVLKFHIGRAKVTALKYVDFDQALLPRLETRTKVDLRARSVRVFDHFEQDQRLVFRSRLMGAEEPGYARQAAFDAQLAAIGLVPHGLAAPWADIVSAVRARATPPSPARPEA